MEQKPPHSGSQGTYDFIADFVDPFFFFSKQDQWHRMGMVGIFADYVLHAVKGNIVEVGVGESSLYLARVADKYRRSIFHCDIAADKIINPLTVPGYLIPNSHHFEQPYPKSFHFGDHNFYIGTSDDFFTNLKEHGIPVAFAFIDGDHNYEQARKDFNNAIGLVVDHGYVVLHDTYPPSEEYLCPDSKCGDVYRLRQELEQDCRYDTLTLTAGAMGVGLTLVRKKPQVRPHYNG